MNADLVLVIGIIVTGFAIPSAVASWSDRETMRLPLLTFMIGIGLIVWACQLSSWQYRVQDVPMVFLKVIGRIIH